MELNHARYYHLRYLQYKYFLDYKDILVNSIDKVATVSVMEGHDVEFEISREVSKTKPIISKMRNLQHSLILRKDNGTWKIVSDNYEDYLWRMMKFTGLSKEDLIQPVENSQNQLLGSDVTMSAYTTCNLPEDHSTYPYNRDGAVEYAHQYATSPNLSKYCYYPDPWGDCTNFVSQAIFEGGGALMVGSGTFGWYYNDCTDHSPSWTYVGNLYDFIIEPGYSYWPAGPEGCDTVIDQAEKGDIVQYYWKENQQGTPDPNDLEWDHSVMIVLSQYEPTYHWVAGHSPDIDGYPYTYFIYAHPNMVYRFVHIVRLDAVSVVNLPLAMNNASGMANQMQNPYPAPVAVPIEANELLTPSSYPAP